MKYFILIIIILLFILFLFLNKMPNVIALKDSDIDASGNPISRKPIFCMIQASYCGHCQAAKPDFEKAANMNRSKVQLCTIQIDSSDAGVKKLAKRMESILSKHSIQFQGVPTYVLWKNGKWYEYEGSRDEKTLLEFVNEKEMN
jgi:thiol-disulfide isomerase/thioredoxin